MANPDVESTFDLLKSFHNYICMNIPVFNKGVYLYTAKLNVTEHEAEWILKHKWHKLRGQPWNKHIGYLFNIVSSWRSDNEILFKHDKSLLPIFYRESICVAYSNIDPEYYDDLIRHIWFIDKQGYAVFFNHILKQNIYLHRYLTNFPENLVVDHIFWNRLDNRISMLRICTQSDNCKNVSHKRFKT